MGLVCSSPNEEEASKLGKKAFAVKQWILGPHPPRVGGQAHRNVLIDGPLGPLGGPEAVYTGYMTAVILRSA